ncbi:hypothetical protein BS47DRAFT_1394044 [Hydnum rufescens UP504]|uniref:Protein kinase domain-containing protein n=1 Tax=Hydnum rufescens UP504 TaxID=1448309 RepID=A0A9P6DSW7_9AGAM|nr:hypothetical protein BS47DRAFT_1394044 [Hydnum rufescens UP504]
MDVGDALDELEKNREKILEMVSGISPPPPEAFRCHPPSCFILSTPSLNLKSATVVLEDGELARGRLGRVFRGVLQYEGRNNDAQPLSVIVKLVAPRASFISLDSGYRRSLYPIIQRKDDVSDALLTDLAHEASLYESTSALAPLQGTVVPRCYGYARNPSAGAACLILEDAGKAVAAICRTRPDTLRWIFFLSFDLTLGSGTTTTTLTYYPRRILYEHQIQIHRTGVSHGDVARRNFVKGPNGIRLIDFDRGMRHECPRFIDNHPADADASIPDQANPNSCIELDKLHRWLGLCPVEELNYRRERRFNLGMALHGENDSKPAYVLPQRDSYISMGTKSCGERP